MAHDVFISHAHKDKVFADAICEKLESAQVRCWIAERDISAGDDWTEATRNAIASSRVMVLVLSENANAAPHIEREIAHAFYTGRIILPLRLTNTPPRRDFLFYLGNVRWFDAFSLPAGQHLEAFTANINGMVRGSTVRRDPLPPRRAIKATGTFSDSWIGALQVSHYRTLEILKRVAIATALVAIGGLLWFAATWEAKHDILPGEDGQPATFSGSGAALHPTSRATEVAPTSKPVYAYSRFGLWVAPNTGPTTSGPQGLQEPPTKTSGLEPDLDQEEAAETESPKAQDGASPRPTQGDHARTTNRQELHRKTERPKRQTRRVSASRRSFVGHIKRRLKAVWHQFVARGKDSD
jgi:hypothetical protein